MKTPLRFLASLGLVLLLSASSTGIAFAQTELTKTFLEKLLAQVAKLEKSCAKDIKRYCSNVTPGEGRVVYCMQAYEDKISAGCAYDLQEVAADLQASMDVLKEAANTCRADIAASCGKVQPGKGRIAACLLENREKVAKDCAAAIQKVEAVTK